MKKLTMMMMVVLMVVMSSTVAFANVANTTTEQNMNKVAEPGEPFNYNGVEIMPGETFDYFGVTMMYTEDGCIVAVKSEEEIIAEKERADLFKKVENNVYGHIENMDRIQTRAAIETRTNNLLAIGGGIFFFILFALIGIKTTKKLTKSIAKKVAVEKKESSSEKEVAHS